MKRPEQALQKAIIIHLMIRGVPGMMWWHTPNQGKRGFVAAAALKAMGLLPGIPDLLFLKDGRLYALELKGPDGRLSPSQKATMKLLEGCGAHVAVAKSLDEALVTLEVWGLLKRDCSVAFESKSSSNAAGGESEQDLDATIRG